MPETKKGKKIKRAMQKHYGKKKGKRVFYASANKGTITGVHKEKKKGVLFKGYVKSTIVNKLR